MKIGIPKESFVGETRVAATPESIVRLNKLGFEVVVESGAGIEAHFDDSTYVDVGAEIADRVSVWQCPVIYKYAAPNDEEIALMNAGTTLVCFIYPAQNPELLDKLNAAKINVLAMDMVPRISRAQSRDALSSMANISGYRAVVEAAHAFGRFFSGQITAAGKVPPAEILVIGAGVAGLAAIGAAGSLGAVVKAFDTRLEVAEQIESMGATFLKLDFPDNADGSSADGYAKAMSEEFIAAEMALFAEEAKVVDVIITTAAIPGKPSPKLITKEMVDSMKPGSVIVDLAAAGGGNCEYTVAGEVITTANGVKVLGYLDLPNRLANQASKLYATNLFSLTQLLCPLKDGNIELDFDDVIIRNMTVSKDGVITFPPPPINVSVAPPVQAEEPAIEKEVKKPLPAWVKLSAGIVASMAFLWLGAYAPREFLNHLMVFVLACVVGYYVVWNVTHSLHTPLMSVTNAISGIIIVGALLQIGQGNALASVFSFVAILLVSVNIFGGFTVTRRMLNMFRKG